MILNLKTEATIKMKGEQKRKQEDEVERNLKNDTANALGFSKHINPLTRLGKFVWPVCLHWIRFHL